MKTFFKEFRAEKKRIEERRKELHQEIENKKNFFKEKEKEMDVWDKEFKDFQKRLR